MPGEVPLFPQGPARNTSRSANNHISSASFTDSVFSVDIGNNPIPKTFKEALSSQKVKNG